MDKWHILSVAQTEKKLNTSVTDGLSRREAGIRRSVRVRDGKKSFSPLYVKKRKNPLLCFCKPMCGILIILYIVLTLFAFFDGNVYFGVWTLSLLLLQLAAQGIMTLRAERAWEKSSSYSSPVIKVLRSGRLKFTDSGNCAQGDVIDFFEGDIICCDARLIYSCDLIVDEFVYNENERRLERRRIQKDGTYAYDADSETDIANAKNIVLAGSVVVSGRGRAIAVSVAEDTLLSKHFKNGEMSGGAVRPAGISKLMSDMKKVSALCIAFLVIFTIAGMISFRETSFFEVFLTGLASILYMSSYSVNVWSRIFFALSADKLPESTVIKNCKAFDTLTCFSDLVLVGKAGLTDGRHHVSSVFLSGRRLDTSMIDTKPDRTYRLCEMLYTYLKIAKNKRSAFIEEYGAGLEGFIDEMGFDREGADLKLKSTYYIEDSEYAYAEASGENLCIAISRNAEIIKGCRYIGMGESSELMPESLKSRIIDYIEECEASGEKLVYVVSERIRDGEKGGKNSVLEGIIALEEHTAEHLNEVLEQYRQMGICVTSLMADEDAESIKYLILSGIVSSANDPRIAFASDFRGNQREITFGFGRYSAYLGFNISDYTKLVTYMRAQGKITVSYGVDDRFNSVLTLTDAPVTCNCVDYSSKQYKQSYYDSFYDSGRESSHISSQRTKAAAHLLTKRVSENSGIGAILHAADICSSAYINLSYFLKYFSVLTVSLAALTLMSSFCGITLINSLQILILLLFSTFAGIFVFAKNTPTAELLRKNKRGYMALPEILIRKSLPYLMSRIASTVIYFVTVLTLVLTGVLNKDGVAFATFIGLYVCCIVWIIRTIKEYSQSSTKKSVFISFSAVLLVVMLLLTAIYLLDVVYEGELRGILRIPTQILNTVYGGEFRPLSLLLAPVFISVTFIFDWVFCRTFAKIHQKKSMT